MVREWRSVGRWRSRGGMCREERRCKGNRREKEEGGRRGKRDYIRLHSFEQIQEIC